MTTAKKTRKALTRSEIFQLAKLIEVNLDTIAGENDGSSLVSYKEGWSDDRVAAVSQKPQHVVRKLRADMFGQLIKSPTRNPSVRMAAQIAALEQRVAELEDAAKAPRLFTGGLGNGAAIGRS